MANNPMFRGDNTQAFGQDWLEIHAEFPDDTWAERITMAEFKVGPLPVMTFENPVFPLTVNLTSEQSILLKDVNDCYLAVYDENGYKQTCEGQLTFPTRRRVV